MTAALIIGFLIAAALLGYVLWRAHRHWEAIGASLLTRAGLAAAALVLSFGAGIVFSAMLASIIRYLQTERESDHLAYLAFGLLGVLAITMWSLHRLLGSKQALDVEFWKFKASMTQGDDPVPVEVVNKASDPVPVEAKGD